MQERIILFIKGFLIGLGKIIPGVSGGLIAISLGVYERLISCVGNIFRSWKENFTFLLILGSGILLAILVGSNIILFFLHNAYLSTMLLFTGLIIGGIPSLISIAKQKTTIINIIIMMIPALIFILLSLLTSNVTIELKLNIFTLFLIGIIDAITMIIPGISGTAVMMTLGVYDTIMLSLSGLSHLNIAIPFLAGMCFGVIALSKIVDKIIKKHKEASYWAIIGFTVSTVLFLIKTTFSYRYDFGEIIFALTLGVLGYFMGKKLE